MAKFLHTLVRPCHQDLRSLHLEFYKEALGFKEARRNDFLQNISSPLVPLCNSREDDPDYELELTYSQL